VYVCDSLCLCVRVVCGVFVYEFMIFVLLVFCFIRRDLFVLL